MTKLARNYYRTAKGEKKLNCYSINIPKQLIQEAEIEEDDELSLHEEFGMIVITKKYHKTCMECDYEWESGKLYKDCEGCPKCRCGDIKIQINGELE